MNEISELPDRINSILQNEKDMEKGTHLAIEEIANSFKAKTCTLHRAIKIKGNDFLELRSQRGLPPHIAEIAKLIPFGKGMAGICAERQETVTMCNLQTDESGVARPAARDTKVEGAVVVPLISKDNSVQATLGIGNDKEYNYSENEIQILKECATLLISTFY